MPQYQSRRKVSVQQLEREPYVIWNEYVDLLATSNYASLSEIQRSAYLAFWYDTEVQNGGHLQYFENQSVAHLDESIAALIRLGGVCQSNVLSRAGKQFLSKPHGMIRSAKEFTETALGGEFDEYDQDFYACRPTITELLQVYLEANEIEFIERIK